jgi:hypothetical protein
MYSKNFNIYKNILKSSLQLQQNKQSLKAYDNMLFAANNALESRNHEKLYAILGDSFSMNKVLFEHYILESSDQSIILMQQNDFWKHAVF